MSNPDEYPTNLPDDDDKATFPETHLSDPHYGWGPSACLESPQQPYNSAASLENAWSRITHRVEWITGQFAAQAHIHAHSSGARGGFSYVKIQALILAIRVALAALDALSELIPA